MATPINDSSSASSGVTLYVGRSNTAVVVPPAPYVPPAGVPSWVPPVGYFADIPQNNTAKSTTPTIYDPSYIDQHFDRWGGSTIMRDIGPLGGICFRAGGHETSNGIAANQGCLFFDFSTLRWELNNIPVAANPIGTMDVNTLRFPDATVFNPHTYLGLMERPTAWGGGARGNLLMAAYTVSAALGDVLFEFDLTSLRDTKPNFTALQGDGSVYAIWTQDDSRQGWWTLAQGYGHATFISKTGAKTVTPIAVGGSASPIMVYNSTDDVLMTIDGGYFRGPNKTNAYHSISIYDIKTNTQKGVATLGQPVNIGGGYSFSEFEINTFSIANGGANYRVGDLLTFAKGTGPSNAIDVSPVLLVTAIDTAGKITAASFSTQTIDDWTYPSSGYYQTNSSADTRPGEYGFTGVTTASGNTITGITNLAGSANPTANLPVGTPIIGSNINANPALVTAVLSATSVQIASTFGSSSAAQPFTASVPVAPISQITQLNTASGATFQFTYRAASNFCGPDRSGFVWSRELDCLVGIDNSGSNGSQLVKIVPPATGRFTNPWTYVRIPINHWANDTTGKTSLAFPLNGIWSRFRYSPALGAFIYAANANDHMQVIRLF